MQKLTAPDADVQDSLGLSVAIHGDVIVAGAEYDDDQGDRSGAAYVWERVGGSFAFVTKLLASDGQAVSHFGSTVEVFDDTIAVGADFAGAAYVFDRSGGQWQETQKLTPINPPSHWAYAQALSIWGDTLAIGYYQTGTAGEVLVYERTGAAWALAESVTSSDGEFGDSFGTAISLFGDSLLVGAWGDDQGTVYSTGSAYLFRRGAQGFDETGKFEIAGGIKEDVFGQSVALGPTDVVCGARLRDVDSINEGAAYAFDYEGQAYLSGSIDSISVWLGGIQQLELLAGPQFAGHAYLILGCVGPTEPGIPFDGHVLPLSFDVYFFHTLLNPTSPPLSNSLGLLDALGRSTASFAIPTGSDPTLAGLVVKHAYVVFESGPIPGLAAVSNAVPVELEP